MIHSHTQAQGPMGISDFQAMTRGMRVTEYLIVSLEISKLQTWCLERIEDVGG